jgi:DNA-binding NarL/FixJ family response regulator
MTVGANVGMATETPRTFGPEATWIPTVRSRPGGAAKTQPRDPADLERAKLARAAVEARIALKEAVEAATLAAQRAESVSAALEDALALLKATTSPPAAKASEPESSLVIDPVLSPREREVLALVAEGRSNKAIAEALYVSPNTIKTHVASLLNKLRAETRVQLAVIAARQAVL